MAVDPWALPQLPPLAQGGIFFALLFAASVFDLRKRIIPDTLCLLIALTGLAAFEPARLFGVFTALPLLLAALIWGGMGGGDVKFMAAAGLVLGFQRGMAAMVMGLAVMLLFHALCAVIQKLRGRNAPKAYPLAPFLSLGCLAVYFII
jgi:leader peptidase (prepilin peptidase)/N-methyltransferase